MSVTPPTQNTAGHQQLHRLLNIIGLICEDEVRVGQYTLDIYCRDLHLGFEFDGHLHERPKQRRHDQERDRWLLETAGIPVFRVTHNEIRDPHMELTIRDWITEQCTTLDERWNRGSLWLPA